MATYKVRLRLRRGSLKSYCVGQSSSKRLAKHWAEQMVLAIKEAIAEDSLSVKVVRVRKKANAP